ncbi:hypothetical protein [Paracoccus sp. Ld10]|uniref:hypothetical protein n=1 Tax=Paracoccus sp. Ld10 TaxID=649158 RepID=UPI0038685AD9
MAVGEFPACLRRARFGVFSQPPLLVEIAHLLVQIAQIQKAVDTSKKMVGRNMRLEIELIEKPGVNLLPSKHRKPQDPCRIKEPEALAPLKPGVFQQHQPEASGGTMAASPVATLARLT